MGYQYYAKMTDDDLDAVVAYLRTVPAEGLARTASPRGRGRPRQGDSGRLARPSNAIAAAAYISGPPTRDLCLDASSA